MYRVSILERPYDSPQMCADYEEAEAAAMESSADDHAYGIWDNDSGILVAIAYQDQIYCS